jgi:pimeloyl-ACP methyl ester carboxylesterase
MADPAYSALEAELAVGPAVDVVAVIAEGADDGLAIGAAADALKFPQLQRRVAIKGVGHWPHLEQPEQVAALFE